MTGTAVGDRRAALLRWGLPRDPAASSHLATFVVATVTAVLLTRGALAAAGYPQIGSGGLHVAHVLWGGLLMAVAFVLLLSFAGPVVRPVGAVVGGVGFGLFVDEVGKFVTADNDYFYEPAAALVYVVVVALVLAVEMLHGRRPHHPREYLAGAADHAVAGLAGGFTPRARTEAQRLLSRAGSATGAAEVGALLDAVEEDAAELPRVAAVGAAVVRFMRWLVTARWVPWVTVGVLLVTLVGTVGTGIAAWWGGADVPRWIVGGLLLSGAVSATLALVGIVAVLRRRRRRAYLMFRWAVLVSLLVTQVFVFRIEQWSAVTGLLVDLVVLGLIAAELQQMERAAAPEPLR